MIGGPYELAIEKLNGAVRQIWATDWSLTVKRRATAVVDACLAEATLGMPRCGSAPSGSVVSDYRGRNNRRPSLDDYDGFENY